MPAGSINAKGEHAMPLLQIRDVRTWFPVRRGILARTVGQVRAVDGVSLDLHAGQTLGLVGESGCGKTTLARTIMGLAPATEGHILFDGTDLLSLRGRALRALRPRLQMIFQDPYSSLNPRQTIVDIVTEGLLTHRMIRPAQKEETAARLLQDVGMGPEPLHRYPHEFSGGQRQRISTARAISMKPSLVVCDEPVSALDVSVQAQVINLLTDLRTAHNLAYLFISHDLGVVRHIADRIAVMYLGRIVESGSTRDVIDHPCHPYTRALVSAVPRVGGDYRSRIILEGDVPSPSSPPPGCPFHPRCPFAKAACRTTIPPLEPCGAARGAAKSLERLVACIRKEEIGTT